MPERTVTALWLLNKLVGNSIAYKVFCYIHLYNLPTFCPIFHLCIPPLNLGEALLSCLPVDYIPYSVEIFGLAVLVLETFITVSISLPVPSLGYEDLLVSMLPRINS